jgi:hypothetical protein
MKKLSRYEQETIILFNEAEKEASIYTCNRTHTQNEFIGTREP